jgi:UDP-glucuronate 4-epimerase
MNILITGIAGFIGFHTSKSLLNKGHKIVGVDNINDYYDVNLKYSRLKSLGIGKEKAKLFLNPVQSNKSNLVFMRLNIEDRENLPKLFENYNFDVVINLAAQAGVRYSIENPETYIDSNIVGFLNILECCRNFKIDHLLYASSSSVYGANKKIPFSVEDDVNKPVSLYAATKKSNELMAYTYSHLYNLPVTGLRFFTVYGPWGRPDMAIYLFADAIAKNKPIKVFNKGDMSRDFTYIDDIVSGINILLEKSLYLNNKDLYRVFNIGKGQPQSLLSFINAIEESFGIVAKKEMYPMQPGDVKKTWADITNLEEIGYESKVDIKSGVQKFIDWYKDYNEIL